MYLGYDMLTEKTGGRVYGNSLDYLCHFSVNLKLLQNTKVNFKKEKKKLGKKPPRNKERGF